MRILLAILAMLCSTSPLFSQVDAEWTTPDSIEVNIPPSGVFNFTAEGLVGGTYDAILAVDSSSSMLDDAGLVAPNGGSQVGDWVYTSADSIIDSLDGRVQVGVVEFNRRANLIGPIAQLDSIDEFGSLHRDVLKESLDTVDIGGATSLVSPIQVSASELSRFRTDTTREQHIILVSDGVITFADGNGRRERKQDALSAVNSLENIDGLHAVGFQGADLGFLQQLVTAGQGTLADGTDVNNLRNAFQEVFDSIEGIRQLNITLPDGSELRDFQSELDGSFSVAGNITFGENTFIAEAISTSGFVTTAELTVIGVPEPSSFSLMLICSLLGMSLLRGNANMRARVITF